MRKLVGALLIIVLLTGLVIVVAGCGTSEKTEGTGIVTPGGKVSVKKSGNEVTITKNGVSKTWTAQTIEAKTLGFPLPNNSKLLTGTLIQVSTSGGQDKWLGGTFYSTDVVNTVISYYKAQLSGMEGYSDTSTTMNGQPVGLFSVQSGNTVKSVIIRTAETGEQGKTWVQIATSTGAGS
jgi:hypothetical protein